MLVKKIFGTQGCHLCEKAKQKYPDAPYTDIKSLPMTEFEILIDMARISGQSSLPLLLDENDQLIQHFDAGI